MSATAVRSIWTLRMAGTEPPRRSPTDLWTARRLGVGLGELSQELLERFQTAAFRETVRYAMERSRFYAARLEGLDPESIRTMADIEALPFTLESELSGAERLFQCVSPSRVRRTVTVPTSGTGGRRKRLAFSDADMESALDFIRVGFSTMCRPGDRLLVMMSGGSEGSIGDTVLRAMADMGVTAELHGPVTDIADAYGHIRELRPGVIVGIPCQAAALARYGQRFGSPERGYIHSVLLSADDVPDSVCGRLRALWGCDVFRHYGMTELCIAGGVECEGRSGYHLRGCDVLFEIVDRDAEGFGEIVVSTLGREAMPLIRYRTGDIGRFTDAPCPCGSPLRRIERIRGRRDGGALSDGRELYPADIAQAVFARPEPVDLSCAITADGTLRVNVGVLPGESTDTSAVSRELGGARVESFETAAFPRDRYRKKRIEPYCAGGAAAEGRAI